MYKTKVKDDAPKDDSIIENIESDDPIEEILPKLFAPVNGFNDGPRLGPDKRTGYYYIPKLRRI